jgi:hypothetical protein
MYDKEYLYMNYKPFEIVRSSIKWQQIATEYQVKHSFKKVMKTLRKKGYVDDHGKSDHVYSLTYLGIEAVTQGS